MRAYFYYPWKRLSGRSQTSCTHCIRSLSLYTICSTSSSYHRVIEHQILSLHNTNRCIELSDHEFMRKNSAARVAKVELRRRSCHQQADVARSPSTYFVTPRAQYKTTQDIAKQRRLPTKRMPIHINTHNISLHFSTTAMAVRPRGSSSETLEAGDRPGKALRRQVQALRPQSPHCGHRTEQFAWQIKTSAEEDHGEVTTPMVIPGLELQRTENYLPTCHSSSQAIVH